MPVDPDPDATEIAQLDADAEAARLRVLEIEDRIASGDDTAKVADLVEAEVEANERGALAKVTRRLFGERAERRAAAERQAEIARYGDLIAENFGAGDGALVEQFDSFVDAGAALVAAIGERNEGLRTICLALQRLGVTGTDGAFAASTALNASDGSIRMNRLDLNIGQENAVAFLVEAVERAFLIAGEKPPTLLGTAQVHVVEPHFITAYGADYGTQYGDGNRVAGPSDQIRRTAKLVARRDGEARVMADNDVRGALAEAYIVKQKQKRTEFTRVEIKAMSLEEYAANAEAIDRAMRAGEIK